MEKLGPKACIIMYLDFCYGFGANTLRTLKVQVTDDLILPGSSVGWRMPKCTGQFWCVAKSGYCRDQINGEYTGVWGSPFRDPDSGLA